jgi:hypothetical protein
MNFLWRPLNFKILSLLLDPPTFIGFGFCHFKALAEIAWAEEAPKPPQHVILRGQTIWVSPRSSRDFGDLTLVNDYVKGVKVPCMRLPYFPKK